MGQDIDKPITVWDDMFLPSEIAMRIADYQYIDSYGNERPLVSHVEIMNRSIGRPVVLDVPRKQWPRELFVSLVFSALLVFTYLFWGKKKYIKIIFGLVQSFLGLFFGLSGSLLFFLTFFTDHDYAYHNSNVFFVYPLFFAAIPLGLIFAFTRNEKKRFVAALLLQVFWTYILLGGFLTMAIKLSPAFYQQNQVTQALVLPAALTMLILLYLSEKKKKQ
jgi:thiamine transporter ThiT